MKLTLIYANEAPGALQRAAMGLQLSEVATPLALFTAHASVSCNVLDQSKMLRNEYALSCMRRAADPVCRARFGANGVR